MRVLLIATGLLFVMAAPNTAKAAIDYPWCAQLSDLGATNCGFVSLEQCRANISGIGGSCSPNPFYAAAAAERPVRGSRPRR